jgi:PAS domain S-box-containing protein
LNTLRERPPSSARQNLVTKGSPLALHHLLSLRAQAPGAWPALQPRLLANTFAPQWLPKRWCHPLLGYLVAVLLELIAVSLTLLTGHLLPVFAVQGTLVILGIVLVALTWGAGPSLLAVLVGTALLKFLVIPLYLPGLANGSVDGLCVTVSLLTGGSIALIASQSAWARRQAQELARSLKEEQARTERERLRLRALLDALPAAVGMMDAQARVLETNPASKALWGEDAPSPGEIAQLQKWQGRWPDTGKLLAPEEWAITRAFTRGETTIQQEVEVETSSGQRKVILDSAAPIRDEQGTIIGGAGIHQDITERKRLEEALRESERRAAAYASELEAIFEAMTDALLVYDVEGCILHHNPAARQLLGFDAQPDFVSLPLHARALRYVPLDAHGQPLPSEQLPVYRLLRGEVLTSLQAADVRVQALDGYERSVSITGRPLRDAEEVITGAVAIMRDVTEQRRLEQHTRDTLDALLAMAETLVQTPDQASAADADAAPEAHQAARRLAELTRSVLGCQQVSIVAVEPESAVMIPITLVGLAPEQAQEWWANLDERPRMSQRLHPDVVTALLAGEPVLLESLQPPMPIWQYLTPQRASFLVPMRIGETLVGLLRVDCGAQGEEYACTNRQALVRVIARLGALVLERERLLCEREEARARELALQETNAQMDTFLGMAGHELKTPLTSIKLALQLAERRIRRLLQGESKDTSDLAPVLEQVTRTEHQADPLDRLVNDLVDVSRVRAGKLDLHLEPADLAAIVREAAEERSKAAPERALVLQFPTDLAVPVTADADRIGQVVTNYLTNALKYSPEKYPVEVGLAVQEQQARVWVRDAGPGLRLEEQEHIWERFHRVKGIEVQSGSGIGLGMGLYICRTIIERHQGQVGVESLPGQGSAFWFTLPLTIPE